MNARNSVPIALFLALLASCAGTDASLLDRSKRRDAGEDEGNGTNAGGKRDAGDDGKGMDGGDGDGDGDGGGAAALCSDGSSPRDELCNDLDDDCDGETDEVFGAVGSDCMVGSGRCAGEGTLVCRPDGSGTLCAGESDPSRVTDELCNGVDDDCDGETDEDVNGPACSLSEGVCGGATQRCEGIDGFQSCQASEYGADFQQDEDLCDRKDNDCDGQVDEACCQGVCDLNPQCGCIEGEACYPTGSGTETTCATEGRKLEGDACADHPDCAPGLVCVTGSGLGGSYCQKSCADSSACDGGPGSVCTLSFADIPGRVCSLDCNPITSAPCPIGARCSIFADADGPYTQCTAAGTGTDGSPCTSPDECTPGFACVAEGASGLMTCRQRCVVVNPACASGTCLPFTPSTTIGGIEFGVCL